MNNEVFNNLKKLSLVYFSGQFPASKILEESRVNFDKLSCESCLKFQKKVFELTIKHPLHSCYSPANEYVRIFLRSIIKEIEARNWEASDELLELYGYYVSQPAGQDYCYRTYMFSDVINVTLLESTSIISNGSTGLRTWPAAFNLYEWLAENSGFLEGKKVIELGSGIGFLGITILKAGFHLAGYTFSDCHPTVLSLLETNFLLNHPQDKDLETERKESFHKFVSQDCNDDRRKEAGTVSRSMNWCEREYFWQRNSKVNYMSGETDVKIVKIDWTNLLYHQFCDLQPEVLIATDVVYDVTIIGPFLRVIRYFMDLSVQYAIVSCVVRNEDTLQSFLASISNLH
ncbi:hypothetical protein QYM36_012380 [Artemia franciscana]|uniref:FAM86 N-terminal domain-containing protein n=1 Tax=Artemia franciscana TaxID=6661 RepID=A0AA88L2V6_ARTSF|nr:hypothetical protein QYM36_012380 [Artemia franciscana]